MYVGRAHILPQPTTEYRRISLHAPQHAMKAHMGCQTPTVPTKIPTASHCTAKSHIWSWSKMMHKALVQHSFLITRIHLLSSTVQGKDGTGRAVGWLREGECTGRLYWGCTGRNRPTCWTMLLCKSLVTTLALKWTEYFPKTETPQK